MILGVIGYSQTYNGTIIQVIDGDTCVFQTEDGSFIVRMQGIDAPERDQPYSEASTEFISNYLNKEVVTKINVTDWYGRRLGTLIVNSLNINLLSIKSGYSWHYKQYSKDQQYAKAEEYSRTNIIVLWDLLDPVPP